MTDKQIIIDGVDVSGCASYMDNGECISEIVYPDYCKACSNCTYKLEQQLKAKEQECEELKEQLTILNDEDVVVEITVEQFEEYKKLKTENRELKGIRDRNFLHALEEQDRADKFYKTLTEIKEIAENGKRFAERWMITGEQKANVLTYANAILQKISEVEDG